MSLTKKHRFSVAIPSLQDCFAITAQNGGVWGKIVLLEGRLRYYTLTPSRSWDLAPGVEGIIAPEDLHRVEPLEESVQFKIMFFRAPE